MGKTTPTVWLLRGIVLGRAHHYPQSPTPLGPAGTPLVPALTHSTSGSVTGNNVRLGTSKDLSAGHEIHLRRLGDDDNTCQGAADECSDYHRCIRSRVPTYIIIEVQKSSNNFEETIIVETIEERVEEITTHDVRYEIYEHAAYRVESDNR